MIYAYLAVSFIHICNYTCTIHMHRGGVFKGKTGILVALFTAGWGVGRGREVVVVVMQAISLTEVKIN